MRFAASDEHAAFSPTAGWLKPYQAAVRAARATAPVLRGVRPRRRGGGHPHDRRGAVGRDERAAVGHAHPARAAHSRARVPAVLDRGAAAADAARAGGLARARPARAERAAPRPRRGQRRARAGRAATARPYLHNGISRRAGDRGDVPAARVSARRGWSRGCETTGPLLWEQPYGDVELPPGDAPLVLVAPSTSQDPEHRMLAARSRRPRRRAGARARHLQPPPAAAAARGAAQRAPRRVGLLRADDAALRRGRLPRGPRHGGAGAGVRCAGGGVPGGRRHGGERRAGQLGRRGRVAAAAAGHAARGAAGGASGCWPSRASRRERASCATGRASTTAPSGPRGRSRRWRPVRRSARATACRA